jgi:hypothetical protein
VPHEIECPSGGYATTPKWEMMRDGSGVAYGRRLYVPASRGWLHQAYLPGPGSSLGSAQTFVPDFAAWGPSHGGSSDLTQVMALLNTINQGVIHTMASLADIKTQLDGLQASEEKLEAFAVATQSDLAAVQAQLADAIAHAADPQALQDIADKVTAMQAGVDAVLPVAPVTPTP